MSGGESGAVLTAAGATITAIGAIVVTVFNWLTARDTGKTILAVQAPIGTAVGQVSSALTQTNTLMQTLISQQGQALAQIAEQQEEQTRNLASIDRRIAAIEQAL